jgi:hypothetical protein
VFLAFIELEVLGGRHAVGEGDGERVEGWLPPHRPACLAGAFGVQSPGDQIQRLDGGLLGRECPRTDTARRYLACRLSMALVENSTRRISTS